MKLLKEIGEWARSFALLALMVIAFVLLFKFCLLLWSLL